MNKNENPGPGQYPILSTITPTGIYSLSQLGNSQSKTFDPPHSVRFKKLNGKLLLQENKNPGPGKYEVYKEK